MTARLSELLDRLVAAGNPHSKFSASEFHELFDEVQELDIARCKLKACLSQMLPDYKATIRTTFVLRGAKQELDFSNLPIVVEAEKLLGGSPELTGPNQGGESCPPPPRICKACECPIDEDGCGCNPHDA